MDRTVNVAHRDISLCVSYIVPYNCHGPEGLSLSLAGSLPGSTDRQCYPESLPGRGPATPLCLPPFVLAVSLSLFMFLCLLPIFLFRLIIPGFRILLILHSHAKGITGLKDLVNRLQSHLFSELRSGMATWNRIGAGAGGW